MNYADVVRFKYPNYVLTKVGASGGNVYEELEWSAFNPEPNPIPKATLDADIAAYLALGVEGAKGDLSESEMLELIAFAQMSEGVGLVKKIGHGLYTKDTSAYLTNINATQVTNALGYTPYDSTNPSQFATKTYVDNIAASSKIWISPVHAFNFVGTATTPPTTPHENENYIISNGGNTGAWSSFAVGDRVSYVGGTWVLREPAHIGCRLGICFDRTTTGVGDALGKDDYIGEITGGDAINGWTWTWTAPEDRFAVFNNLTTSVKFGETYTYIGTSSMWVPFAATTGVADGSGLYYSTGSTLNVNVGKGISIVSDKVTAKLYPSGGLITTLDGTTSSSDPLSSISLEPVGTPGTYTKVTVDSHGRVTTGTNPTTLAGYNILDAQPLDTDLTAISNITGTGFLKRTGIDTWALDTNTYLTSNQLITVSGDATGSGTTAIALTLADTGVIAGTYNNVTVNSKGLVTSASNVSYLTSNQTITLSGDVAGSGTTAITATLSNTGVAAGTYENSSTAVTPLTFDAKGRLTAVGSPVTVTPLVGSLQQSGATTGQVIQWNGTAWEPTTVASVSNTLDGLTDVIITTPTAGQTLYYNGSEWVNFGSSGDVNGGGAAKRIWSSNVPASTGTTVITPGTTAPLVTAGTQIWAHTVTPYSTAARYVIQSSIMASGSNNGTFVTIALFRDSVFIGGTLQVVQSSSNSATLSFSITDIPNTTSPVTYQVRLGISANTWYVNRRNSEITYNGQINTGWVMWEY